MLLCFDFDGVIVDSLRDNLDLINESQRRLKQGRAVRREDLATLSSMTFQAVGQLIGIEREKIEEFTRVIYDLQKETDHQAGCFYGVREVLQELSQKNTLVIVSASESESIWEFLRREKLNNFITEALGGESYTSKAERIRQALQIFQIAANETYMIGDSRSDIREGKTAGVRTIGAAWGYQAAEVLRLEAPDYIAASPRDLLEFLHESTKVF
ncbi:HAD family hydrolase [bacterium]|nr:HAD family hydrolase [bacterium]